MKIPLFIAHGQELANFLLVVAIVLWGMPIVACLLAAKKKRVPAVVAAILAVLFIGYVAIQVGTFRMPDILFLVVPLVVALVAIGIAVKTRSRSQMKKPNQSPQTTRAFGPRV
jgi:putative Ca2+/H+ antiporter (TMEM165/GDT1 family)